MIERDMRSFRLLPDRELEFTGRGSDLFLAAEWNE